MAESAAGEKAQAPAEDRGPAPVARPSEPVKPAPAPGEKSPRPLPVAPVVSDLPGRKAHASPSVRRFARELGADISAIAGSGHKQRITKQDVQDFIKRKLSGEDITYRGLVEKVRLELAESYLADGSITLAEISYLVGFSSQAAFSRAFKRWTGLTPRGFRDAA